MIRGEELVDLSVPRLFESAGLSSTDLPPLTETKVLTVVTAAAACDLWFKFPASWPSDLIFRLYGRVSDARVLLKYVELNDVHRTTSAGDVAGIAASLRGVPVTSLEVTLEGRTSIPAATSGRVMLHVWSAADQPSVGGGVSSGGTQQLSAEHRLIALRSGSTPVLAAGDSTGRALVAGAGTAGVPAGGVVSVQPAGIGSPAYAVSTQFTVKPSIASVGTTNIITLRSGTTKRVELRRILLSYHGVAAAAGADGRIQALISPADHSVGTSVTPLRFNGSSSSAAATARVGAASTGLTPITWAPTGTELIFSLTVRCDSKDTLILEPDSWAQPWVLRTSQETFGIRFTNDSIVASQTFAIAATIHFIEI